MYTVAALPSAVVAEASGGVRTEALIVLSHGIDGDSSDLGAIADKLAALSPPGSVEIFNSSANAGKKTHDGVFVCAERLWSALRPTLERLLAAQGTDALPLKLSFIGHSMGGLILRQVAFLISEDATFASNLEFDTIAFIASPFLGCRRLGSGGAGGVAPLMSAFGPSLMRAGLRFVKGETGPQLLLDNDALERLTDEAHCAVLRRFGRRLLYTNGSGDWLVNFESCSLLTAEEIDLVLPPSAAACAARGGPVLWKPTEAELPAAVVPPSLALACGGGRKGGSGDEHGRRALLLQPLGPSWDPEPTVRVHATWDDRGSRRGRQAAAMLRSLRGVGSFELWVCHFFKRSSFAGMVFSPHIDLVLHPKCSQRHGVEVVDHLADNVLSSAAAAPPEKHRASSQTASADATSGAAGGGAVAHDCVAEEEERI